MLGPERRPSGPLHGGEGIHRFDLTVVLPQNPMALGALMAVGVSASCATVQQLGGSAGWSWGITAAALLSAAYLGLVSRSRRPPPQAAENEAARVALETLAAQNAELSSLLWKTVDRLQVLSSIDRDFSERTLDLDSLLKSLASRTCDAVGEVVGVYLVEEHQPALRAFEVRHRHLKDRVQPLLESEPHYLLPTLPRLAMESGCTRTYEQLTSALDAGERALFSALPQLRHALLVPIKSRTGEGVGAVWLMRSDAQGPFTQEDRELIEQVVERASLAIDNARLYRARETFLGLAAHELRTPTTALRAQAQLMLRRLETLPVERVRSGLETIERQTGRLTRLINDLLDVTRIEASKLELREERTDGGVLADELVERFEQLTSRNCFKREGDAHGWVAVDPVRLDQVLSNLLTNAVKFCEQGDILLRTWRKDREVVFSVIDHGPGISREKQTLLFERFSQVGNDADRRGGLGLGLYLSRELVLRMGGRIWVESDGVPGHPTAFHVSFPEAPAEKVAVQRSQPGGPNALTI